MSHEVETMAFAHATPWHGLGNDITQTPEVMYDPEKMLEAAGIHWDVSKVPLEYHYNDKYMATGKNALVRSDTGDFLTIVGDGWQPLNNREAFRFFNSFVGADKKATMETAGSLRGGRYVWGLANLNHGFTLPGGDPIKGYLLLVNPHEFGKSIQGGVTPVRVVCANTLRLALSKEMQSSFRHSHATQFDPEAAAEFMALAHEQMSQFEKNAKLLIKLKLSWEEAVNVLSPVYQPGTEAEAIISGEVMMNAPMNNVMHCINEAPGAKPGTGWGVLNGVTYYADHVAGRSQDSRLYSSWMGTESGRKNAVLASLLDRAGA